MNELTNKYNALTNESDIKFAELFTNTLSKTTRLTYRSDINGFFKMFFGTKKFEDITEDMIKAVDINMANEYVRRLMNGNYTGATINKKLASLNSFYTYLLRRSVPIQLDYNPFASNEGCVRLKNTTESYSAKTDLSDEEVRQLLLAIPRDSEKMDKKLVGERDYLIMMLLLTTGIRRQELVDIKFRDLRKVGDDMVVRIEGKGNKVRFLKVPEQVYQEILNYADLRLLDINKDKDEYLVTVHTRRFGYRVRGKHMSVTNVNRMIEKYCEKAGLTGRNITPHSFRHTFCTTSLRKEGTKMEDVQDEMGHSRIETTRRYDHINRTIENSTTDYVADKFNL